MRSKVLKMMRQCIIIQSSYMDNCWLNEFYVDNSDPIISTEFDKFSIILWMHIVLSLAVFNARVTRQLNQSPYISYGMVSTWKHESEINNVAWDNSRTSGKYLLQHFLTKLKFQKWNASRFIDNLSKKQISWDLNIFLIFNIFSING